MRILLGENMPEGLLTPLRLLGHTVDSIASLHLKGLENSPLYREVARGYDLCHHTPSTAGSRLRGDFHGGVLRYRLVAHRQREPMAVTEARAIILSALQGG